MQATHTEVSTAVEVEDAEASGPLPVGSLEAHGIGSADVKKLRESGYHTIESVVYAPKKALLTMVIKLPNIQTIFFYIIAN